MARWFSITPEIWHMLQRFEEGSTPTVYVVCLQVAHHPFPALLALGERHTEEGRLEMIIPDIDGVRQGEKYLAAVRPEDVLIKRADRQDSLEGFGKVFEVYDVQCIGPSYIVRARHGGLDILIESDKEKVRDLRIGEKIGAIPIAGQIRLYDTTNDSLIRASQR